MTHTHILTVTVRRGSEPYQQTTIKSTTISRMHICNHRRRFDYYNRVGRFLLLIILQLLLHSLQPPSILAYQSYDLTTRPFTNTNSTIPPEYDQQNTTSQAVFDPDDLRQYWCDDVAWVENGCVNATWCWTRVQAGDNFRWTLGDYISAQNVLISPTGLIGLGFSLDDHAPFIPSFMSRPQPDYSFEDKTLITFYNAQILWNIKELNYSILYPYNTSSNTTAALIRIRGSLISFFNASRPNSHTTLEFEVQLDSATEIIVMHIISLENATAADLHSPISIGLSSVYPQAEATMFINNEFVTNRTISRTLIWTPYLRQNLGCLDAIDCSNCLQRQDCYFCESTSSCVDIYHNLTSTTSSSSSAIIPISSHCPEGVVLSTCPPALIYSCHDCVVANAHWCTGQADCYLMSSTATAQGCTSANGYANLQAGELVPYCVGANETCGQQTCNQLQQSQHSQCTVMDEDYNLPVSCQCAPGYESVDQVGGVCSICSLGYYKNPDDGSCAECPSVTPVLIVIFLSVGIVITFVLIKLNSHPLFRRLLVPIQNSIVYFQVVSLLELIDFHWPLSVRKALTAISIMGLNLFHFPKFDIDCYLTTSQALTFTLLAPILILVLLFLCGIIGSLYVTRHTRTTQEAIRESNKFSGLLMRAFLTFLLLYYNHLVWQLMDAYTNDSIDWSDTGSSASESAKVIGGTLVYLVGIPLLFWFLTFPRHQPSRCCCCIRPVSRSSILIPLISRYRPGLCQYWECTFVPLWKILFNAIVVFGSGRNQQIALLTALLLLMIFSYTMIAPYTAVLNNREQSWLMGGSLLILLSGLFFYESEPGDTTGKLILLCLSYFLIIGTMVLMVILMGYVMVVVYHEYKKEQAKALDHLVREAEEDEAAGEVDRGALDMVPFDDDTPSTAYLSLSTNGPAAPLSSSTLHL